MVGSGSRELRVGAVWVGVERRLDPRNPRPVEAEGLVCVHLTPQRMPTNCGQGRAHRGYLPGTGDGGNRGASSEATKSTSMHRAVYPKTVSSAVSATTSTVESMQLLAAAAVARCRSNSGSGA